MLSRIVVTLSLFGFAGLASFADDEPPMELEPAPMELEPLPRLPEPDIMPASEEPTLAMQRFKLPPGFEAALWAAEPMLANPVAFNFDDRGRLFLAETYRYGSSTLDIRGYMHMLEDDLAARTIEDRIQVIRDHFGEKGLKELAIEGEVLRLLEDTDGDGVADKSSIYADGFNSALDGVAGGVLPRGGEVWFANIPSLWHFTGEDQALTRKELSRGYGVHFNYTGHDLHGLTWGPDGKLYFSVGDRGAEATAIDGSHVSTPDTGAVFRCDPDGGNLEIVHWGLRNPQDLLFTENGDLFTGDNDSDQGDQERLVQIVEGGDSGWRIGYQFAPLGEAGPWNLERMWWPRHEGQPAFIIPPICNVEDGPSGIAYYPGTGLAPGYDGTIFITHFKGAIARSGIQAYRLRQDGATYAVKETSTFLANALPTDVGFGPDGRLYYSDWAEGWPKSKRGRIYALFHPDHVKDPLVLETRKLLAEGMDERSPDELERLLGHADQRVRLNAQFALAARGKDSLATFARVAASNDAREVARLHAIWGLGQLAGKGVRAALEPLPPLLGAANAEVRAQAARLLGDHGVEGSLAAITDLLRDENNRVRYFAAQSLGRFGRPESAPALIAALRENDDRDAVLRHGLVMGLVGAGNHDALAAAAGDPSRAVRLGVLLSYRRLASPEAARFLKDADPFLVGEAARAINDVPIAEAMPALAAFVNEPRPDNMLMLRALNATFRLGTDDGAKTLAAFAARADIDAGLRAEAVGLLALWPKPPARDRIVGVYRPVSSQHHTSAAADALGTALPQLLAGDTPDAVQAAVFTAIEALDLRAASDTLFAAVGDTAKTSASRVAALETLASFEDPRLAEAAALAGASDSAGLRLAALPIASKLSPEAAVPVLENLLAHGSIAERRAAFESLAELRHPGADRLLAEQLRALAAGEVPIAAQIELLEAAGKHESPEIKQLLAAREAALAANPDPLAPYEVALAGGRSRAGMRVFNQHPVMTCQRCHLVDGQGGEAGPDLSNIGAVRTREQLLESVIKPNASIAPGFDNVVVTQKSGDVVVGIVASETPDTLTLRQVDGGTTAVPVSTIQSRGTLPSSMPEIFGAVLTKKELRDVIEYLAGLKSSPTETRAIGPGLPRALRATPQTREDDASHGES